MWHKRVLLVNVFLSCYLITSAFQFPDNFVLSNPKILNNCIASGGKVWDTQTKKLILSVRYDAYLTANSIFCSDGVNTFIYSNSDGHLLAWIPYSNFTFNPLSSYIWTYSGDKFIAYTETGQYITNFSVDATQSQIYTFPDEIRYTKGNSIYKYLFSGSGEQMVGGFYGSFSSWFLDGEYFLTTQDMLVRLYDKNSNLIKLIDMPVIENLSGTGTYIWAWNELTSTSGQSLVLYRVNNTSFTLYPKKTSTKIFPTWRTIGILPYGTQTFSIIELAGSEPVLTSRSGSGPYLKTYNSDIESNWTTSNNAGVVNYGTLSGNPTKLNFGKIRSLFGNSNSFCAIATSSGNALVYTLSKDVISHIDTFEVNSSKVRLSSDGKYLFCGGNGSDAQYSESDLSLYLYDIASQALLKKWYHNYFHDNKTDDLIDFDSSKDGLMVSQKTGYFNGTWSFFNYSSNVNSTDSILINNSDNLSAPQISPSKEFIATSINNTTRIYRLGTIYNIFAGRFTGWISNNLFIASSYIVPYTSCVYTTDGQTDTNFKIPFFITSMISISDSELYVNNSKVINIKTGNTLFSFDTIPDISTPTGRDYIMYFKDNTLKLINWRLTTGIDDDQYSQNKSGSLFLGQNYPNPFNTCTSFTYSVPVGSTGFLKIYTSSGDIILNEPIRGDGIYYWDAADKPSGIYICQITSGRHIKTKKMILIK